MTCWAPRTETPDFRDDFVQYLLINDMATFDNDVPDVDTYFAVQPYQFEPMRTDNNDSEQENLSTDGSDIDEISAPTRMINTEWYVCFSLFHI